VTVEFFGRGLFQRRGKAHRAAWQGPQVACLSLQEHLEPALSQTEDDYQDFELLKDGVILCIESNGFHRHLLALEKL
jgi:hypothetical protein